ncbi:MAG: hypothetical protein ACFFDQ_07800 [Candidatus Thorarchaeota archaeon]
MSRLEEVSSKRLVIIDNKAARKNHLFLLAFSLLIGVVYSSYFWFVCSTQPGIISSLLLFGSQIAIGIPATRAYYDLGVTNKDTLRFIDPAQLDGNGELHNVEIHLGEIPSIFEKLDLQTLKYDKGSLDDLSDLAWFGIFVWSAFSSTSFFFGIITYPLCLMGTVVFLIAALMSYLSGFRRRREYSFEEDLNHLQYLVEKRLKCIDNMHSRGELRVFVNVLEKQRMMVIMDFNATIKLGKDFILEYHMGFPSNETERIIVKTAAEKLAQIFEFAYNKPEFVENKWRVKRVETSAGPILVILNESSNFSVNRRSSFMVSPLLIDESSSLTSEVWSAALSLAAQGRLS